MQQAECRLSADPVPGFGSCPHCRHVPLKAKEDGLLFQELPRRFAGAVPPARILHRLPSCAWQLPVWVRKGRESPGQRDTGAKASPLQLTMLF